MMSEIFDKKHCSNELKQKENKCRCSDRFGVFVSSLCEANSSVLDFYLTTKTLIDKQFKKKRKRDTCNLILMVII